MPSRTFLPLVSLVSLLGCGSHSTAVTRTPQTKKPLPFHAAAITLEEHNARAADPAKFCSGFHAAATTLEEYVRHFLLGMYRTWGDSTQFGGEGRVLANGVRFSQAEGYARDVTCGMLFSGVRLPSRLGSGFLFWDQDGLWKSDTFTGPLTFVDSYESGEMPGEIRRVRNTPLASGFRIKSLLSASTRVSVLKKNRCMLPQPCVTAKAVLWRSRNYQAGLS